ncbi:lactonase family protein [Lederbergia wuyishanensis]|uniref:6-phosphogluconolactonase n=1 Tax=Lederbergia wuyishanensis TaxID=1347903 RepID=A0ABU0D3U9_9BACI|nr:lactonase family protein [Lederbergia wuyishanensis]MCJ8007747.1 lactonase family protein [Lederbergia wuyishanensis]MDQ0343090.1 6-phosphogluconolactonase [Lederbergia wuyishanensis]
MGKKYIGFAGTYTRQTSKGIYRFVLDTEKAELTNVEVAAKVGSPTYLAISEENRYLYSVAQQEKSGGVATFSVDSETGELNFLNAEVQEGAPPCHLDVFQNDLVTGNYHEGTVELYKTNNDGINPVSFVYKHEGTGPHVRQEKSHVHYTGFTPDKKFVVVADLGTDEVVTYKVDLAALERVNTLKVRAGSGPRHLSFHPNGKVAYLLTELSSEVVVLDYNAEEGSFTEKQYIRAIPEDFTETNDASAIHISSDGRFVYTGNRGHNSIAVFSVDTNSGELTFVEHTPSGGEWPRDFVLDPSESFLIASNQNTGNLVLFARDQQTGKLTKLNSEVSVPEVVCVKFLK